MKIYLIGKRVLTKKKKKKKKKEEEEEGPLDPVVHIMST